MRLPPAIPMDFREADPWKITSSIRWPRSVFGLCSPRAQRMASATLDLPQPFGPTMQVIPGSTRTAVFSAKDLKPWRTICWSRIVRPAGATYRYHSDRLGQRKKPHAWGRVGLEATRCGPDGALLTALQEAALLVLLAGPAGARVVPAELAPGRCSGLHPAGRARDGPRLSPPALLPARRRCRGHPHGGRLVTHHPHLEELLHDHQIGRAHV